MDTLKAFEDKIALAVEKVKALKDDKAVLVKKIQELEGALEAKDQEIAKLSAEKSAIKGQIEGLLSAVESLDIK